MTVRMMSWDDGDGDRNDLSDGHDNDDGSMKNGKDAFKMETFERMCLLAALDTNRRKR